MRQRAIDRRLDAITVEEWWDIWEAGEWFTGAGFDKRAIPRMRDALRAALGRERGTPPRRGRPDVVDLINGADDDDEE